MDSEKLEIAKTWFVLAEILGVVAGLFILSGSFLIHSSSELIDIFDKSINICEKLNLKDINYSFGQCFETILEPSGKYFLESNKLGISMILIGFLLSFNAIYIWLIGRFKMSKETYKDWFMAIIIFILDIIYFYFIYRRFH